jgi:hypothetical protein
MVGPMRFRGKSFSCEASDRRRRASGAPRVRGYFARRKSFVTVFGLDFGEPEGAFISAEDP